MVLAIIPEMQKGIFQNTKALENSLLLPAGQEDKTETMVSY